MYSDSITLNNGSLTIKAKAFKTSMTDSDTASATYTISSSTEPPATGGSWPLEVFYFLTATTIAAIFAIALLYLKRKKKKR